MTNQKILSPAMLKTYEQCRKKFFLRYIRNIMMPQPSTMFEKGKNIHALANYFLSGLDIKKFELALDDDEKILWDKLKNNNYFNKEVFRTEFTLNFKLNEHWFGGRVDAIVKSNNDYFILDYKTGSAPKEPKYDYQTMVYSVALDKYLREYNSLNFVYIELKTNENVIVEITDELIKEYQAKLQTTATKIMLLSENNLPSFKDCKCEYSKICF